MKRTWIRRGIAVVALLVLGWVATGISESRLSRSHAAPSAETPTPLGTTIAFMDVGLIFKKHKLFNDSMKALEGKVQLLQQNIAASQAQIDLIKGQLGQATEKAEIEKLEAQIAKLSADMQVATRVGKRDLAEEEAKIYCDTYAQIQDATKKLCRSRGIQAVFRANRVPMQVNDPASVQQGINRAIIYAEDGLDITDDILKTVSPEAKTP
jgi:Skp family chaperone for outer membrane proteins